MADIDDELLALAGGSSDDEGSGDESRRSESPPPRKDKKLPAKKTKRRARDDDGSEEEGEASDAPSTPNSLESAPMEESDSEAEAPSRGRAAPADSDNKYPVDGFYTSQAEKAQIQAMREVDREQLFAERHAEIERQRQNRLLRQMVNNSIENEGYEERPGKKKRTADSAQLDDDVDRKSSRARTGKDETGLDTLQRRRAEKQRRKDDQERRKDTFSPRRRGSPDAEESDDDYGRHRSGTPQQEKPRDLPPAELRDYDRVRLGRNEFAQVCFTPGFESAIKGCYIRIALGPHPETGVEQYRMAAIKEFATGKAYALNGPNGSFVTDQYVRGAHGKAIKEFPFIAASSGKFTESELNRFKVACHNEDVSLPTKAELEDKIDDINRLINHEWTNVEIKARLTRKNDLRRRFDPAERERVSRLLEEAREKEDEQRVDELQDELDKLSSQRLAFKTSLGPSKLSDSSKQGTEQDRLAERNRENRRLNVEAVRKAQLRERAKALEIEAALKRGETVKDDPSRRLRTKAKFVHDVTDGGKKSAKDSGTSTPTNGAAGISGQKASILPHLAKLQEANYSEAKGMPTIHKPLMDDDVIGALDLDIDVEI